MAEECICGGQNTGSAHGEDCPLYADPTRNWKEGRPDFGMQLIYADLAGQVVPLSCRYYAPGLTLQDLVALHDEAYRSVPPEAQFSGNPSNWPITRGVRAVADAVIDAMLDWHRRNS